jgi:hypothetical protein
LVAIRREIAESPFVGEGHKKITAPRSPTKCPVNGGGAQSHRTHAGRVDHPNGANDPGTLILR